ncbi:MAG: hypothetical protein IJN84_01510 [Clostridia bacterium]|nr:hypothetical protein [Clostridia bacterium]
MENHRIIFETVMAMFTMGKKIDYVTILDELKCRAIKAR